MSDRTQSYAGGQTAHRDEIAVIVSTIDKQQQKYADILPTNVKWPDFRNAFLIAVQTNPRLLDADRQSLWLALQKAASSGLKPDGQESALVIFGDDQEDEEGNPVPSVAKGKKKVVFMPMVWGITKQMRNTGNIASVRAKVIYKGERVVVTDENGQETYKHERVIEAGSSIEETDENIVGAYAVVAYKDGFWDAEFMSLRQLMRVKAVSKAKKGPWLTFFPQQCMKTPLRRLSLRVEKSAVNARYFDAIQNDETLGPTIDAERPSDVMVEFSAERQGASIQKTPQSQQEEVPSETAEQIEARVTADKAEIASRLKAEQSAIKASAAEKRKAADSAAQTDAAAEARAKTDTKTDTKTAAKTVDETKQSERSEDSGFDHFGLDETTGEPVEGPDGVMLHFTHPGDFAVWYVGRHRESANPLALEENNADALAEVRQHKAAGEVLDALKPIDAPPKEEPKTGDKPIAAVDPLFVPLPLLPNNKPNLPKYCLAVTESLRKLPTETELEAWITANSITLANIPAGGAYAMKLDDIVKARGNQIKLDMEAKVRESSRDVQRVADVVALLNAVTSQIDYDAVVRLETTKALAKKMTAESPDLRRQLREADDAALQRIKAASAKNQQPPPISDDDIPWDKIEGPE